jgi:rhodanese-related sulfurtransferase
MNNLLPGSRDLLEALILILVACAAGLSLNYQLVFKSFAGVSPVETVQPAADGVGFPEPVDFEDLERLLNSGYLLVDARAPQAYLHSHLSGALSLPLGEAETLLADFMAKIPLDTPLILYCNGFGCPDSFDLGVRLLAEGYTRVLVYEGGFPEWRDRGGALKSGETP